MFRKFFNSTYYKVPSKVNFLRTFNMKAFYNIFKVIFKYSCKVRFCWNYFIIFSKDYFFILENFVSKVRLNNLPEMLEISFSFPEKLFHVEIIIAILFWSLEKFNAVLRCFLYANWSSAQLNFTLTLLRRRVRVILPYEVLYS